MRARSHDGEPTSSRRRAGSPSSEQACRRASALGGLTRGLAHRRVRSEPCRQARTPGERARSPAGGLGPRRPRSELWPACSPSCPQARRPAHRLAVLPAYSPSCPRARHPARTLALLPARSPSCPRARPPARVLAPRRAASRFSAASSASADPAHPPASKLAPIRARARRRRACSCSSACAPPRASSPSHARAPSARSERARRGASVLEFGSATTGIEKRAGPFSTVNETAGPSVQ